jgi:hypothetical protein
VSKETATITRLGLGVGDSAVEPIRHYHETFPDLHSDVEELIPQATRLSVNG